MVTIDLHTHSIISYDGGIREADYKDIIESGRLTCIAITDHNEVSFALKLKKSLGENIIVGEEIATLQGEMIGLFLKERVTPGQSALETAKAIRRQRGLVYISHPFETKRSSMQHATLESLDKYIDIVEVFNARGFLRGKSKEAIAFAKGKTLAMAVSSDAHSLAGVGSSFSVVDAIPRTTTLVELLNKGDLQKQYAPFYTLLSPTINRIRKRFRL